MDGDGLPVMRLGGLFEGLMDEDPLKWNLGMIRTIIIDGYTSRDCFVMDGLFDGRWIIVREWIALMGPGIM